MIFLIHLLGKKHDPGSALKTGCSLCLFILLTFSLIPFSDAQSTALQQRNNVDSLFTQAQIAMQMSGKLPEARSLFQRVIELQPDNAEAHAQLSAIYLEQEKDTLALAEIKAALRVDSANNAYKEQYALVIAAQGKYLDAAALFHGLSKATSPPQVSYLFKEAWCYKMAGKYPEALAALDTLEKYAGSDDEHIVMEKLKLHGLLNQTEQAEEDASRLVRIAPRNPSYYLMLEYLQEASGKPEAAVQTMDTAVARFPKDPKIVNQAIVTFGKFDKAKLQSFYRSMLASDQYNGREKAALFYPLIDVRKSDPVAGNILYTLLPQLAFGTPPDMPAVMLYAGLMIADQQYDAAVAAYRKGIAADPTSILPWAGLLDYYQYQSAPDSLALFTQETLRRFPDSPVPYYYMAVLFYRANSTDSAIAYLEKGKTLSLSDSTQNKFLIYSFLGTLYQERKQPDSAAVNYEAALEIKPDDPELLNNYSYLLAEESKDLSRALRMSGMTLKARPDEAMFLDTYGWILFKQKKYAEAKIYVERAIEQDKTPDAAIYEHLGDIESALGNRRKARAHWQKARSLGNHSTELQQKWGNR